MLSRKLRYSFHITKECHRFAEVTFAYEDCFSDEEVNINFTSGFISKFPFTLIDRSTAIADKDLLERFTFNLSTLPADWQAYFISSYDKTFPCNNIQ